MSFGFDPLVATLLHPSNPEDAVRHAIGQMRTATITALQLDLTDEHFTRQHELTGRHVKDRLDWLEAELTARKNKLAAREAHRVRAEETNLFADLADDASDLESLRKGKVEDV